MSAENEKKPDLNLEEIKRNPIKSLKRFNANFLHFDFFIIIFPFLRILYRIDFCY